MCNQSTEIRFRHGNPNRVTYPHSCGLVAHRGGNFPCATMKTKSKIKAYNRAWYCANKAKVIARSKEWSLKNPDRSRELKRQGARRYYNKNSEKILSKHRIHYHQNAEEMRLKRRVWHKEHRASSLASSRAWKRRNSDRIREYKKTYYAANAESLKASGKLWREKNQERYKAKKRQWEILHPERNRFNQHRRRAIKFKTPIGGRKQIENWESAWKKKSSVTCYWCKHKFNPADCHTDHIIALSIGGAHEIGNLCISCVPCNKSKYSKSVSDWNKELQQPVLL